MSVRANRILDIATIFVGAMAVLVGGLTLRDRFYSEARVTGAEDLLVADWTHFLDRGPRIGPEDAAVTILEWGDYECPACRVIAPTLADVQAAYPEEVAVVYRHWPLQHIHPRAYDAARASECAERQDVFQEMHKLLNAEQGWRSGDNLLHSLQTLAARAGVADTIGFRECIEDGEPDEDIEMDIAAVKELGGRGTPTLLINGRYLRSIPDSARWHELVREALKR